MLYKHVSIRVQDEEEKVAIIRVADLVDAAVRPPMGNMVDIDLSNIRFQHLVDIFLANRSLVYNNDEQIKFLHCLLGSIYVAIGNDKQLTYTIQQLQIRRTSTTEMRCR